MSTITPDHIESLKGQAPEKAFEPEAMWAPRFNDTTYTLVAYHAANAAQNAEAAYWLQHYPGSDERCVKDKTLENLRRAASALGYDLVERKSDEVAA